MMDRRLFLGSLLTLPSGLALAQGDRLSGVASFSILGDMLTSIAGPRVAVATLVGPNSDAHAYQPKPSDSRLLASAQLVVVNGLGFEGFIDRLVRASGSKALIVTATKGIEALQAKQDDHHGHDHGPAFDPHAWQSVANAKRYVTNIRDGLISIDPQGATVYGERTVAYLAQLDSLEADIRAEIARVRENERRVLSSHDAFGYFAKAYGIQFIPAQGLSAESEPTAAQIAALIRQLRREKVKAVFTENVLSPKLAEQVAKEAGAVIGGKLYSDALSDVKGPAPTYIEMMRYNARTLVSALLTA